MSHNLGHTRHLEEVSGAAEGLLAEHRLHLGGGHLGVVRVGTRGGGHEPRGGDQGTCDDVTISLIVTRGSLRGHLLTCAIWGIGRVKAPCQTSDITPGTRRT